VAEYVLDTHACVFALVKPQKLGERARKALRRVELGRERAWIPAAVAAELVLLHELGRISIGLPELEATLENSPTLGFLPLDFNQIREFASLASIRDPFDRLIVGAARSVGGKLVSKDANLRDLGIVQIVW